MAMGPITLPASFFAPDNNQSLETGDAPAGFANHMDRIVLTFDDTNEEAAVSMPFVWPQQYASGTVTAYCYFYMASDASNDIALDVFVEAITPDSDTLDLEAAEDFHTANSGTHALTGTAGDLHVLSITLTNKDSVAAGDLVRIGVRRDCDSGNDDAAGDLFLAAIEIRES